ncbi:Methyltransferase domain-containing protein [Desulfocicer vacuolatum DSM 3385]|uniref:Methyltransferase domain-containing protein n=1 Tax=Desulfocicer vacuolatum DSM 3385 TaxID=1121400 RepID=A0A1W2A3A2_9BACT|nr:class I SAM-dependent methyltransferase [Desulfocicer vacuolatum]SMC55053.1 Methyltransferase domain-containing protein [Desulfocicer vacuolatum DSM 3385]
MDYYHKEFQSYFNATVHVDPAPFLLPVITHLPVGGEVWDVGCGSGRDLLWLKQKGFKAVGLERSQGLASLAAKYSGCRVIQGDFNTFDFSRLAVDAIFLTGALVHVPHRAFLPLLRNIIAGLKPGGVLFLSLKEGHGVRQDEKGRRFYLWQEDDLVPLLQQNFLKILNSSKDSSLLATGENWLAHVLKKAL